MEVKGLYLPYGTPIKENEHPYSKLKWVRVKYKSWEANSAGRVEYPPKLELPVGGRGFATLHPFLLRIFIVVLFYRSRPIFPNNFRVFFVGTSARPRFSPFFG